jgi:ribosomal protein S1
MSSENPAGASNPLITAEMHAEIEAAMKELEQSRAEHAARAGAPVPIRGPRIVTAGREHRYGKVVAVGPADIFVEFGPKEIGIVPKAHYPEGQIPELNTTIEVVIDRYEPTEHVYLCSRPGAVQKAEWELLEPGQVVEARVTGVAMKETRQAGLELEVAGHEAFMPAGQVSLDHVADLSVFVGEKVKAQVMRVDRAGRGSIVLSRREVLLQERKEQAEKLKATLAEGQTVNGTVRKIMDFGCFVDIGGVDGLVHVSDLSYDRVNFGAKNVERYVKEGQQVTVRILKLDWENKRISLGLKQTQADPFLTATNTVAEGAEVTGRVTRTTEFGAFVEIGPGVEGLVHISELDHKRVASVDDAVKVDEIVRAKVLKIDKEHRRISLSIKALKPLPELTLGAGGHKSKEGRGHARSPEQILKETPALRRMREKARNVQFKGGLG